MEDRIHVLPEIIASQIAAGEVVETPSSAVKEMMENAVDAGARSVTVNFSNGGRDLIQVIDDGCGMSPADAVRAFECHATSKITTLEDIYALRTFGFRGEALSSIAAVSQVELLTRRDGDEVGTRVVIAGGEAVSKSAAACPKGSQFTVRNIFYNTPARRKFIDGRETGLLKAMRSEFRRVALCHPEVAFTLLNSSTPIYSLPVQTLAERIVGIMGQGIKPNLLEVGVSTSIAEVRGYVGQPSHHSRGGEQFMFVNGRYFASPYLAKAVQKAYAHLIPDDAKPSFFIFLTVDPDTVDVNVHAKKTEVRFTDEASLWQILHAAVRETLAKTGAVPLMDFDTEQSVEIPVRSSRTVYSEPRSTTRASYNPFTATPDNSSISADPESVIRSDEAFSSGNVANDFDFSPSAYASSAVEEFELVEAGDATAAQQLLRFGEVESLSVIHGRYCTSLRDGRLILTDLSRAREAILYDSILRGAETGHCPSQQLLFPETISLGDEQMQTLKQHADDFDTLGFDLRFGPDGTVTLEGVPAQAVSEDAAEVLRQILDEIAGEVDGTSRAERMASSIARSGAYSRNTYTAEEARNVIGALGQIAERTYTPGGKRIETEIGLETIRSIMDQR